MLTGTLQLLAVAILGHVLNTFVSYLIHLVQHHRIFGLPLYRFHQRAHHNSRDSPPTSADAVVGRLVWSAGVAIAVVVYSLVLPPWIAWIWVVEGLVLSAWLLWIHREYDNPSSWFLRFAWFRHCRDRHGVHHAPSRDFTSNGNFAIGGPVLGMVPDRLFGTYADRTSSFESPTRIVAGST